MLPNVSAPGRSGTQRAFTQWPVAKTVGRQLSSREHDMSNVVRICIVMAAGLLCIGLALMTTANRSFADDLEDSCIYGGNANVFEKCDRFLRRKPSSQKRADAYLSMGKNWGFNRFASEAPEVEKAIRYLSQAIPLYESALDPNGKRHHRLIEAYELRARAFQKKGQLSDALRDLDRSIQIDIGEYSTASRSYARAGIMLVMAGETERAIKYFSDGISRYPNDGRYLPTPQESLYYGRGRIFFLKGRIAEAIADFSKAIEVKPKMRGLHTARGMAFFAAGDFARAADDFRLASDPAFPQSFVFSSIQPLLPFDGKSSPYFPLMLYSVALSRSGGDGAQEIGRMRDQLESMAKYKGGKTHLRILDLYLGKATPKDVISGVSGSDERCAALFYTSEWFYLRSQPHEASTIMRSAQDACAGFSSEEVSVEEYASLASSELDRWKTEDAR